MLRISSLLLATGLFSCSSHSNAKASSEDKIPVENIVPTKDQKDRRIQSEAYCKAHGIPVYTNPNSLFVDSEAEASFRTKDEVVDRALALCYIGLKSEGLEQRYLAKMDADFHISSKLTPTEQGYARAKRPTEQQKTDAGWRYESLHVMLWALSFVDTLSYPDRMCNVASDVKIIHDLSENDFREKAKLRSKKEILDQADLILRLNWACTNARMKQKPNPGNLDQGVVFERHYSFNWLIKYMGQEWDDVTTDT
ncbi:DUF4272 domain-containing protein [Hymenobacter jejuensis]|uniref:DUF4272 domain-containing protein n=1 Tax=Hymenobacter jejuensis TaxID=2502781 RepID=A0A5B7ZXQ6_9BACT|nr:DUF4272 domain-containing protein [Hymenobacter jejuensis]QDA59293.1 DUF4272 domain-containing protein [Hymenobacter jejuensis]